MAWESFLELLRLLRCTEKVYFSEYSWYWISDTDITDDVVLEVASLLRKNKTLVNLRLNGTNDSISLHAWQSLVEATLSHGSIERIGYYDKILCLPRLKVITDTLKQQNNIIIKDLDFSDNKNIPVEGFVLLFDAIRTNQTLEDLYLSSSLLCSANEEAESSSWLRLGQSIKEFLQQNTKLTRLYMDGNCWSDTVTTELGIGLQTNKTLLGLCYASTNLKYNGTVVFAKVLHRNMHLKYLNLCNNQIGDEEAITVAKSLRWNISLEVLYLHRNNINTQGMMALAEGIKYNTTLLHFSCNVGRNYPDVDTIIMLDALQFNTTLRKVAICPGNKSSNEESAIGMKVTEVLEYNDTITDIQCSWLLSQSQREILSENTQSKRTAPKKGARVRMDIIKWLDTTWIEQPLPS